MKLDRATTALLAASLLSYLWLCVAWFDHDLLPLFASTPAGLPLGALLTTLGVSLYRNRSFLRLGADGAWTVALVLVALLTRLPFLWGAYGLFSSDAAAQGVMALHILEGRHHPIFLYDWSYIGTHKAHLTALFGWISGEPVESFAFAAIVVYAAFVGAVYRLARTVSPRPEALAAALYVILSPGFLTAWGVSNEGNYIDVLFVGTLMLAVGARWMRGEMSDASAAFSMGLLGGFAFWIHILATYYLLTAVAILILHRWGRRSVVRLGTFGAGFAIGDFPGILWNWSHGWQSFLWWSAEAPTTVTLGDRLTRTVTQLGEVLTTSLPVLAGYWPHDSPPSPRALWFPLAASLFPFAFAAFAWRHRTKLKRLRPGILNPEATLMGFALLVALVFALSSFGWMTEQPRYLLFLFSVLPVFVASGLRLLFERRRLAGVVVAGLLAFLNARGSYLYLNLAWESDPLNREFVAQLERLGVRYVQSDYHLSYKYVFLSHGRMVWTSELGPSQTEWYAPFREEVASQKDVALVPRSFRFARRIERRLDGRSIRYRRENLLYPVLFDFDPPVRWEDLR